MRPAWWPAFVKSQPGFRSSQQGAQAPAAYAQIVRELIERFEAHLTAGNFYSVIANMRGDSAEEVAAAILGHEGLRGLQVRGNE